MTTLNPSKTALVFALFLGGWHALWSAVVAAGFAQPLMDFVFWMHFIKPPFEIEAFDLVRALILVAVTGAVGYVFGLVFSFLWNALHK